MSFAGNSKMLRKVKMPEKTEGGKRWLGWNVAASVSAVLLTGLVMSLVNGFFAHATTEQLTEAKAECAKVSRQLKVEQEKADLELQKVDTELKIAQKELHETVTEHIKVDAADTREIMTTLRHIQTNVKKIADKQDGR